MNRGQKWAVYHETRFWLADTCAGGAWSETFEEAVWFDSRAEATAALRAAEIVVVDVNIDELGLTICRVR